MITAAAPDLTQLAHKLGIELVWHTGGDKGRWHPESHTISLRRDMGPTNQRCTLAHELAHAVLGHQASDGLPAWLINRQERDADRWAAQLLISETDYATAEVITGGHPGAIARELGVTLRLVEVWRELHERKKAA